MKGWGNLEKWEILVDKSLENELPSMRPIGQTWIFVRSWKEVEHIVSITRPARIVLRSGFEPPPDRVRKLRIPPLVLVVPRVRSLRFSLWMRYLPFLDFVITQEELLQDFQRWMKVLPFSTNFQKIFRFPIPFELEEILDFIHLIKKIRFNLTEHQWKIFMAYGKTGEVNRVAEIMGRHPRTIRDQIARISEKVETADLEDLFRKPAVGLLSKIPGSFSPPGIVPVSGKKNSKTGAGNFP